MSPSTVSPVNPHDDPLRAHRSKLPTFLYPFSFAPPIPSPIRRPKAFLTHPYTLYFFGLVNAIIAGAVLPASGLVYGWWTNGITDAEGNSSSQSTRSSQAGWIMTLLGVCCLLTSWLFLMCFSAASDTMTANLRRAYVGAVLSQDQAFFDRYGSGEIASRAGKDINTVRTSFGEKLGYIFWSIGTLLASIIPSFILAARLAGVVIACLPFSLFIIFLGSYFVDRVGSRVSLLEGRSASTIEGILSSVRIVQAFDMAPALVRRLDEDMLKRLQKLGIGRSYARAFLQAGMYFTLFLGFSVSFWFAGIEIVNGLSVGFALTVFWNIINAIFALANILPHIASLADAGVAIKALRRQIERDPYIDVRNDEGLELCAFDDPKRDWEPSFEFQGITFAYPSRPGIKALDDVSFEIEAGKFTALVGYSGSGKSTSAALILREYDPSTANLPNRCDVLDEEERRKQNAELEEDEKSRKASEEDLEKADEMGVRARNRIRGEGIVLFAGRDIRQYKLSWLRKQIAVVSQSPQLFSASIFENVAMGLTGTEWEYRPETDGADSLDVEAQRRVAVIREKVEEALRKAQAWDFVAKLPQGLDTIINGGRAQLSGGQAQRVALARAIIRKPAVLLLDEATSALDTASENKIKEMLDIEQKERGMTLICIAHRISTVVSADKVIVMAEGRNVDEGTYEELLDSKRPDQTFRNITLANQAAQASPDEKVGPELTRSRSAKALTRLETIDDGASGVLSTTTTCVPGLNPEASTPPPFPRTASSSMRPRRPDLREVMSGRGSNFGRMDHLGEAPVSMAARTDQAERDDIVSEKVTEAIHPTPDAAAEYIKAKRYSKFTLIRRFGTALGKMKWWFMIGILLSTAAGAGWPIEGWMVGEVVDELRVTGDDSAVRSAANKWAFWFLILAIVDALVLFANGVSFELSGGHLMRSLKRDAMLALTRQEIGFFDTNEETDAGALTSTVTSGPTEVTNASGLVLSQVLIAFWNIIGSIILGFVLSWRVTIVALPPVLVLFVSGWLNVAMLDKYEAENAGPAARTASFITENVNIIRTIASLGRERAAMRTFDSLNQTAKRTITYLALGATGFAISQAMVIFLQALLFYWGGELIARGQVSIAALYACFEAVIIAGFAASRVFTFVGDFGRAFSAFGTIQSWLDRKPKIPTIARERGDALGGEVGDIVLHGVEMRYPRRPNHPALKDISLRIEAGKTHALCGSSGSGKSSILALVLRFYEPTKGQITFGGRDSTSIPLDELRSRCAYVSQDPQLFEGSVRWNLLLGASDPQSVTQKELEEVCEQACILDFVRNLKDGFETEIGMKGAQLSGGERQRLCIARALLRRPEVLLLDEATSALDARSELAVQRALDNASKGRTTITLAHRLSTIRKADTISVIEDGLVREQGSHDELIKLNGRYVELIQAQL